MPSVAEAALAAVAARAVPEKHRDRARRFYSSTGWRRLRYSALRANAQRHGCMRIMRRSRLGRNVARRRPYRADLEKLDAPA